MRKLILISILIAATWVMAQITPPPDGKVTLTWDYPTNELTGTTFYIYHSRNVGIPVAQWQKLTNVIGTNRVGVTIIPGANFFACTASNFWGESDFSAVVSTPALPRNDVNMTVTKTGN